MNRRPFILLGIVVLDLLLTVPAHADENRDESRAIQNVVEIGMLNTKPDEIDMAVLETVSLKIAKLFQEKKLDMMRVKIFAEHPIVKEAMADKTIKIVTSEKRTFVIFVPLAHRGKRVIVKETEPTNVSYSLYSLPDGADLDLGACLKH